MGLMHANGAAGFLLHVSDTFASQIWIDSTATWLYRTTEYHTPDKQNFAVHSLVHISPPCQAIPTITL